MSGRVEKVRDVPDGILFDFAHVCSPLHEEVAVETPASTPAVLDDPVVCSALGAPPDQFYRMTSNDRSFLVPCIYLCNWIESVKVRVHQYARAYWPPSIYVLSDISL